MGSKRVPGSKVVASVACDWCRCIVICSRCRRWCNSNDAYAVELSSSQIETRLPEYSGRRFHRSPQLEVMSTMSPTEKGIAFAIMVLLVFGFALVARHYMDKRQNTQRS